MVTVIVKVHVYCWKYHPCRNWYNIFSVYIRIHVGMTTYNELIRVYILSTLKLIFVQAVLNTVVYQMLIYSFYNVLVNSAVL